MKTQNLIVAAVLAAAIPASALAQQPTSPVAPRAAAAAAPADGKVAVLLTNAFYDGILELKSKESQVETKFKGRVDAFKAKQTQYETMAKNFQSQQGVASADKMAQMGEQIQSLQKELQRTGQDLQDEIQRDRAAAIAPVQKKLTDFLKAYAAQRNIVLVLDKAGSYQSGSIAYIADTLDITDDFIAEYNKANPVPGAAAAPARAATR